MKQIISVLVLLITLNCFSQKQANVWYFGNKAGIDFSAGAPQALDNGVMTTDEGCATISDSNGKLLFYTDGRKVFNRLHKEMPNGSDLAGSVSSTQSAVIIKSPANDSIYYVFTVGSERQETGLCYSEVNLNRDGGNGAVVTKNIRLLSGAYEKIGAVSHCNNRDSWVVGRRFGSSEYYAFLVTKNGVETTPVMSSSGISIGGAGVNSIGVLRFSSNGKKIAAMHSYENDIIELMDFDGLTGKMSNPMLLRANPASVPARNITGVYGAEFSSDSKLLYVSWYSTVLQKGLIAQFDVTSGRQATIQASLQHVFESKALPTGIQMGPDGKIYISCLYENYISVVNNPNVKGMGCNVQYQALKLGETGQRFCLAGLPSFVQSYFSPSSLSFNFSRTGDCSEKNIKFLLNRVIGADSVKWNFGDPNSGASNTSNLFEPTHQFPGPGVFDVSLVVYKDDCTKANDTVKQSIWVTDFTKDLLGPDRLICSGEAITVSVPVSNIGYTWSTGSTASSIKIDQSGLYWLEVNQLGCSERDSITVDFKPTPSVNLGRDTALCAGETLLLNAATGGATYQWSTGQTTPDLLVRNSGQYSVKVTVQGCAASDTIKIEPGSCKLFIPNAFTPNGDGLNDGFGMLNTGSINTYSLIIYDRWGKRIFATTNKNEKWNGMTGGRQAQPGTYVWILTYTKNGEPDTKNAKGTVELIR
ncbi:gliding motility-associated C-terminal domain-containing protein [Pollutibacter soli]|uniref:T9SS type B sorting domain-containing protein n=1 Tax=Pollutibacter soli TaxID=3034157 RepID=UPI003013E181